MTLHRRQAIAATAALFAAARTVAPRGAFAQSSTTPEVRKAVLGYIALTDAAPLIIAKEKGFFAKHGMPEVEVSKQASWGATRDNLVLGGGSNLVVADQGFAGRVVEVATTGMTTDADDSGDPTCSGATVTVAAGAGWDDLVRRVVAATPS